MREVRLARDEDEPALRALSRACAMNGPVAYTLEREPDFHALTRLQGTRPQIGVIDGDEGLVAMGTGVFTRRHLGGAPRELAYFADLKVHPSRRGTGLGGRVLRFAAEGMVREGVSGFAVVLAGNRDMAPILGGSGVRFVHRATIRKHSTFLVRTPPPPAGVVVRHAREDDLEDLVRLLGTRDLAPAWNAAGFSAHLAATPGLSLEDVLVAERGGRLVACGAPWDGNVVRQVRVLRLSPGLRCLRRLYDPAARLLRRPRMPADGELLPALSMTHLAAEEPGDLRALLVAAHRERSGSATLLLDLSLDRRAALAPGLRGFLTTHVDFDLHLVLPRGAVPPEAHREPVSFDLALA